MKLPTFYNGEQDVRIMTYSTDQAGLKKEQRLETLPEGGLPAIELEVVSAANPNKPVYFTDKNKDGDFTDDQVNPFPTAMGTAVLWGMQETMKVFQTHFGWIGMDDAGKSVKCRLVEKNDSGAQFDAPVGISFFGNGNQAVPYISLETIAHEFTHAIQYYMIEEKDPNTPSSPDYRTMCESVSTIFGSLSKHIIEKPVEYNWLYGSVDAAYGKFDFQNPNLNLYPDTYKGDHWNWSDPNAPDWDVHKNMGFINHCFYLLAVGSGGPKTNDHGTEYSCVGIGVEKSAEIFWGGMTMLKKNSNFIHLRNATLEVVAKMGHPVGSPLDMAVREAWKAVGMGQELPFSQLICKTGQMAESVHYGVVPINTAVGKVEPPLVSDEFTVLIDCMQGAQISTMVFDPHAGMHFIDTNDADKIYTLDNNETLSKQGVSVHFATSLAKDYFQTHHNFSGLDGNGQMVIYNMVGNPDPKVPKGYNQALKYFKYDITSNLFSIDRMAGVYFTGLYKVFKNPPLLLQPDANSIIVALADIFGLEVNNLYRKSKGDEPLWTTGNDATGGKSLTSFSNPSSYFQLQMYKGLDWDSGSITQKAGVLTFWYYLISAGTPGLLPKKNESRTAYVFKMPEGLPEKVAFHAFKNLPLNPSFEDFAVATELALNQLGYGPTSPEAIANHDALYLVGLKQGTYASTLEFGPVYEKDENNNYVLYAWPVKVRAQVEYPLYEGNRLFEVSTDPDFNENKAQVYRAFQSTSEGGSSLDEKNPGIKTVTAEFYLDEGVYYTRSRLAQVDLAACEVKNVHGQQLCRDLEKKLTWTEEKAFTLKKVTSKLIAPVANETAQAWYTWFKWQNTLGAFGHTLHIEDLSDPSIKGDVFFKSDDPNAIEEVEKTINLGQNKNYQVSMRAKQTEGSPKGVALLWNAVEEKFNYEIIGQNGPAIYGEWTNPIPITTNSPSSPLLVPPGPADGEHVPPFGQDILLSAEEVPGASGYRYHIQDKKDDRELPQVLYDHTTLKLPDVSDGKVYTWAFEPYKDITPPFITEQEFGKKYFSTFVVDYSLVPAPVLVSPRNDAVLPFQEQASENFGWQTVVGADEYDYSVSHTFDDAILAWGDGSTPQTDVTINNIKDLPDNVNGGFKWRVRAKAKDEKGDWIYGPYSAPFFYWLRPTTSNLIYPGENVQIDEVGKVDFAWGDQWAPDGFLFRLFKDGEPIFEKPVKGTSITLANLQWGGAYAWDAPAMNVTPIGTHFPEPYTFRHFTTKDGVNNGKKKVKEYDPNEPEEEEPADPNDPNNPNQPQDPELGKCPGFFNLKVTNSQYLSFTLTSHAIGSFDKTYGFKDSAGQPFLVACANCTVTLDEAYTENDDVEIYVKILSLASDWIDIPVYPDDETPIITITDPFGIVIGTLKMTIFNWEEGKEIYLGRYTCSKYK
ncbi:M4 family metallopeptidase [Dyadobacter sp. LJ53]|uniref:M4 family metallopeptidase n=1 Tax=Dyadobacter chenwenxiniae TaxID=2906456 RepID=UPI001F2B1783|nr:M4 family metallopeptidase [Dyadobacter chenwenxiniae]MCF0052958.1 M4 family metallopeptidase [Dyadobacter chenwenxiniae]